MRSHHHSFLFLLFLFFSSFSILLPIVSLHSSIALSSFSLCISPLVIFHLPLTLTLHLLSSLWSAHPSLLLLLLPQGYLPSYTGSPHPSLSLHLFISMSKSHPFIFLQMNRLGLWKRTEEKMSRTQRSTVSLSP